MAYKIIPNLRPLEAQNNPGRISKNNSLEISSVAAVFSLYEKACLNAQQNPCQVFRRRRECIRVSHIQLDHADSLIRSAHPMNDSPYPIARTPNPITDPRSFWLRVARTVLTSRALDRIEEQEMAPKGLVTYQFSARGHDLAQAILSEFITHPHDGATCYYRSRPFVLGQGLTAEEAFRGSLARAGGMTDGRDIGVVHLLPRRERGTVLPASGDVGAQYSPGAGWAQSIGYYANVLKDESYRGAIAVALGGDASTATNGFWAALNIATTLELPMLFFIEDNGYGISVTSDFQTPGRNIAKNLAAFGNLQLFECKGYEPEEAEKNIREAVEYVRTWQGPALIRVRSSPAFRAFLHGYRKL